MYVCTYILPFYLSLSGCGKCLYPAIFHLTVVINSHCAAGFSLFTRGKIWITLQVIFICVIFVANSTYFSPYNDTRTFVDNLYVIEVFLLKIRFLKKRAFKIMFIWFIIVIEMFLWINNLDTLVSLKILKERMYITWETNYD